MSLTRFVWLFGDDFPYYKPPPSSIPGGQPLASMVSRSPAGRASLGKISSKNHGFFEPWEMEINDG